MIKDKFTFKTEHPTGQWRTFHNSNHYIKIRGKRIGQIDEIPKTSFMRGKEEDKVRIKFQVIKKDINEDDNPNCEWKWITLKRSFDTVDDAKKWLNTEGIFQHLNESFNFYYGD